MTLAGRIHTLTYNGEWDSQLWELARIRTRSERLQIRSALASLREMHSRIKSRAVFVAITKFWIVPTLRVLSLTFDWTNTQFTGAPDIPLVDGACWLLRKLDTLAPLLEVFSLVVTGPLGPGDDWNMLSATPSSLARLSHLRQLHVSIEMLPHIWPTASELPLLSTLIAREHAKWSADFWTNPPAPPIIHPFPRGGFRSLESLELFCSWTRAQSLFPESMDLAFAPMLSTLILKLPGHEEASGWDFRCFLHCMGPLKTQIQNLILAHAVYRNYHGQPNSPRKYVHLSKDDLDGLRSFTALRHLSIPTQQSYMTIHDIIGRAQTHPHMIVCTIFDSPNNTLLDYPLRLHTMFLDRMSCSIARSHYPAIVDYHKRQMHCHVDSHPPHQKRWCIEPPLVITQEIPIVVRLALQERLPCNFYALDILRTSPRSDNWTPHNRYISSPPVIPS